MWAFHCSLYFMDSKTPWLVQLSPLLYRSLLPHRQLLKHDMSLPWIHLVFHVLLWRSCLCNIPFPWLASVTATFETQDLWSSMAAECTIEYASFSQTWDLLFFTIPPWNTHSHRMYSAVPYWPGLYSSSRAASVCLSSAFPFTWPLTISGPWSVTQSHLIMSALVFSHGLCNVDSVSKYILGYVPQRQTSTISNQSVLLWNVSTGMSS